MSGGRRERPLLDRTLLFIPLYTSLMENVTAKDCIDDKGCVVCGKKIGESHIVSMHEAPFHFGSKREELKMQYTAMFFCKMLEGNGNHQAKGLLMDDALKMADRMLDGCNVLKA
jgi:hypothetical protein